MNKHIPLRMCMACRQMKPKDELIRLVIADNKVVIDAECKCQSRGAYVCKNQECAAKLKKIHAVERHMKADAVDVYDEINMFIQNK